MSKFKVGDKIKSDAKFDYVVTQVGPKLLFKVQYENLEENFQELVTPENIRPLSNNNVVAPNKGQDGFYSEGDKVEAKLFDEWNPATIIGSQFGEYEITCYKKGVRKAYFSEWITSEDGKNSDKEDQMPDILVKENFENIQRNLSSFKEVIETFNFSAMVDKVNQISITEKWDDTLENIRKTYIKPTWDGTHIDDGFHIFLLACSFDREFTKNIKNLFIKENLRVTMEEQNLHKSRVLLLVYSDNASYDDKLVRLLTRGAELANSGELCIITLIHPSCSLHHQNIVPDNMAYSLADSSWYSLIGIDSAGVKFQEMVSQVKSYTCELSLDVNDFTSMAGLWYCKYVVSGDFCSNFYDSKTIALHINHEKGKLYGRTTCGILLDGNLREDRVVVLTGAYCGPWKQLNEGWEVDFYKVLIYIKGVLDYKGDRFEGQIVEISQIDNKLYECVGTISAKLHNQGVSGFYEYADSLSTLRGEKFFMAIVHQKGGDILADIEGHHGTTYPGIVDINSKRFWIYVKTGVSTCATYEGNFNLQANDSKRLQISGSYFKCENGITILPRNKFNGQAVHPTGMIKVKQIDTHSLSEVVANAQERTLRSSISNSVTFVPPDDEDFPTLILASAEDSKLVDDLKTNLMKAGVAPISCEYEDLHRARTVCLILTVRIRDNEELISKIKHVSTKGIPFYIICADARGEVFADVYWKDLDLKQSLMSCLARLMQTGRMTLNPTSIMFSTLVKEIKSKYMPPIYFLSGLWSIRTFDNVKMENDYREAEINARKGKQKKLTAPKLVYILCDGATGNIVGLNDFISTKTFQGGVDNEKATFIFDNEDSKYELVIDHDGKSMQGTYTSRLYDYSMDITLTLELDDISGVYRIKDQSMVIGIVKTGKHTVDVHYGNYVLPGVCSEDYFCVSIPRCIRGKPVVTTMCGVLQKSMSGSSLICFDYASVANVKCLEYTFYLMQTKFQKLDESDKINAVCEPLVKDLLSRYVDAYNNVNYDEYRDLHSNIDIESKESFTNYCVRVQDILGKIESIDFVGKKKMNEESLSHLSISRYEFDLKYSAKTRREFFIIDENSKLKGNLSLEEEAEQFHTSIYDVMITYRSIDGSWADFLQIFLEQNGILCWRDQRMEIGSNWSADITSAIRLAKCELCLLSEEYLKSEMCTKEITLAYDSGKIIVPIVLPYTNPNVSKPMVKSTYKPAYPPHHISHETSQSTWIDFRPSSVDDDPQNLKEFIEYYETPLHVLLCRLKLAKVGSHICDINGEWIVSIRDTSDRIIKKKIALEYHSRIPVGILQEASGKPIAHLSSQSIIRGTRLQLYFVSHTSREIILGIKAMMSGDNKSFSGVLMDSDNRSTVFAQKVDTTARPISRGPLVYKPGHEKPLPNFKLLRRHYPHFSESEIEKMFKQFCELDTSKDFKLSADEIVTCLKKIGKPLPKRLVLENIRKYDVQQSGVLDFDEFLNFITKSSHSNRQNTSKMCSVQ